MKSSAASSGVANTTPAFGQIAGCSFAVGVVDVVVVDEVVVPLDELVEVLEPDVTVDVSLSSSPHPAASVNRATASSATEIRTRFMVEV
jgi:hypothetical protein